MNKVEKYEIEFNLIFSKMKKVIETSEKKHKKSVNIFLCLANKRLNEIVDKTTGSGLVWPIVGGSYAIRSNYEEKFGKFYPMINA